MKRIFCQWSHRCLLGLSVLSIAVVLLVAFTPQGWAGFQTGLFVLQIMDSSVKPQRWFTPAARLETVSYPLEEGFAEADIYRIPDRKQRPAVVLFLGANAAGRDDPDVKNLGLALARAGFVVMVHWSPEMVGELNINPAEIDNLVWAYLFLRQQEYVDASQVGLGGFCVGASFAIIAATDPRIREEVAFVNAFGPYYDARDLLLQIGSRLRWRNGGAEPWEPNPLTLAVFANELIEALESPLERDLLYRKYLMGEAVSADELNELSEDGAAVRGLLDGVSPAEAERLYEALPAQFAQAMASISPRSHLAGLQAQLLIMHDRDDLLIPADESRRLAEAVAAQGGKVRYTEFVAFDHVRPGQGFQFWKAPWEVFKFYRHMYGLVRRAS